MRAPSPRGDTAGMARGGEGLQLVWFRRDLRLDDNPAVRVAADGGGRVACCFVLDPRLYEGPEDAAARVRFLLEGLQDLDARLQERGGGLLSGHGDIARARSRRSRRSSVRVRCTRARMASRSRSRATGRRAASPPPGAALTLHHDQTLVEHERIAAGDGTRAAPTRPTRARWRASWPTSRSATARSAGRPAPRGSRRPSVPSAAPARRARGSRASDLRGGETAGLAAPARRGATVAVSRATPAHRDDVWRSPDGTSRLSPYLKLGMLSPRRARASHVTGRRREVGRPSCSGATGSSTCCITTPTSPTARRPALRAGRAGRATTPTSRPGAVARRVSASSTRACASSWRRATSRTASAWSARASCCKHLHVDWRRGERWYRAHLSTATCPRTQAAGSGSPERGLDAAPYFRVMNPVLQEQRFDPAWRVRRALGAGPAAPMLDLAAERARALELCRAASTSRSRDEASDADVDARRAGQLRLDRTTPTSACSARRSALAVEGGCLLFDPVDAAGLDEHARRHRPGGSASCRCSTATGATPRRSPPVTAQPRLDAERASPLGAAARLAGHRGRG